MTDNPTTAAERMLHRTVSACRGTLGVRRRHRAEREDSRPSKRGRRRLRRGPACSERSLWRRQRDDNRDTVACVIAAMTKEQTVSERWATSAAPAPDGCCMVARCVREGRDVAQSDATRRW